MKYAFWGANSSVACWRTGLPSALLSIYDTEVGNFEAIVIWVESKITNYFVNPKMLTVCSVDLSREFTRAHTETATWKLLQLALFVIS